MCRPRAASHAHFRHRHPYGLNSSIDYSAQKLIFILSYQGGRKFNSTGTVERVRNGNPCPRLYYHSGCRHKYDFPRPLTPQACMLPLVHYDLQRHVGVNNLPTVVTPDSAAAGNRTRSRRVASPSRQASHWLCSHWYHDHPPPLVDRLDAIQ